MPSASPYRFGSLVDDVPSAHVYPNVWSIEKTTGPDRLVLAPSTDYVELLTQLISSMEGPYGVLHVLLVSRSGRESGRYETSEPMEADEMRGFLRSYSDYLEHDGRHHTWFFGLGDGKQVIYDNHNLIYCYGDLDKFRRIAEQAGLVPGEAQIPAPHMHSYNAEFDADEDRIFTEFEWTHYPLQPGDEP